MIFDRGLETFSIFISYRVVTDAPVARLLFDAINHSVTPAGHRVVAYLDATRLVGGENWEDGFSSGLLHSLVFLPLLSYGATAPMAALPLNPDARRAALAAGWDELPAGRRRLEGAEGDLEDNMLKEILIASAILERAASEKISQGEEGCLQVAYPIMFGR
jgi:hypothetical protein